MRRPCARMRVWPASVSVVLHAFPRMGESRTTACRSVEARGRRRGGDVRGPGLRVVGRTGRGLVPVAPRSVAAARAPADRRVHRSLCQLRRGPLRLPAALPPRLRLESAMRCNAGSMRTGPGPRPDQSSRCWTIWSPVAPGRCWSVRSPTGWPDCRPRRRLTRSKQQCVTLQVGPRRPGSNAGSLVPKLTSASTGDPSPFSRLRGVPETELGAQMRCPDDVQLVTIACSGGRAECAAGHG
jgi:hypothetical protein